MSASKKMVINAMATYFRMLVAAGLAIFSGRWVIQGLGNSDYGLFNVVGSIIGLMSFINAVMAGATVRHLSYSIGANRESEVRAWFAASFYVHLALGILTVGIGAPIGEYFITHILNIPPERIQTSLVVFRISLVTAFFGIFTVPFVSMHTAKQKITNLALWGIIQAFLSFALALSIRHFHGDRLLFYAIGFSGIGVVTVLSQSASAFLQYPECVIPSPRLVEIAKVKSVCSFSGWSLIGGSGVVLRDQGSAMLINVYFGAAANAAYAIANQVSFQTRQLSEAVLGAISPEITARAGKRETEKMLILASQASRVGVILVTLFAIPLILETPYILTAWLKTPPAHTASLCRWILATFIVDRLTTGFSLAISANGKVAGYQLTVGGGMLVTLPIAAIILFLGFPVESIGITFFGVMIACTLGRAIWAQHLFNIPFKVWLFEVVLPILQVITLATLIGMLVILWMHPSFFRLVLTTLFSCITTLGLSYYIVATQEERGLVTRKLRLKMGLSK